MAGVGPTDLHDLALEVLAAAAEALDTVPTYAPALGGAPERRYVAPGPVALDCCDQLTVHVGALSEGASAPGVPRASDGRINRAQFVILAARCVPAGPVPPVEDLQAAAAQINADKWALWNHLYNLVRAEALFDKCCDVIWGQLLALTPSGGCGGSLLTITVCYDGYEEILGTTP